MTRDLFAFNRATEKIESIATTLGEIARSSFDALGAKRDAEKRFSHMIDPSRRSSEVERMLRQEVERVGKESEQALSAEAFALASQIAAAEKAVDETFDAVRPHRDVSTATAVMLSQERWEYAKALLEAPRSLAEVVSLADLPTLLAIEAFAPEYLYAQSAPSSLGVPGGDFDATRRSVDMRVRARLAELAEGPAKAVLEAANRARGFVEIAWAYAEHLQRRFNGIGVSGLEVGVTVAYIRREYGIDPKPAEARRKANESASSATSARFNRMQRWGERVQSA